MTLTLGDVMEAAGGRLVSGHAQVLITGVAALADAGPGEISFFGNPKYIGALRRSRAAAVLVPESFELPEDAAALLPALIAVPNPSLAFAHLVERFAPTPVKPAPGIAPTAVLGRDLAISGHVSIGPYAVIEDGVQLGDGVVIGAHVYIGQESVIGAGSHIYPHVTIRERIHIGARAIIHSGAVIGSDGFGFELQGGRHVKIPQTGTVEIGDDVEIGANAARQVSWAISRSETRPWSPRRPA
jgi:UDP-3-O-[3-hydroxymyristoyl] glucosamine N-acyltransferase